MTADRLALRHALLAPEYWLLIVAALCAALGLSAWIIIPLAVAGLSINAMPKYIALLPRARAARADRMMADRCLIAIQ